MVKNPPANAGATRDSGLIPGSGRSPGGGNGNPFQYSCLENPQGQRSLVGYSPWGHKQLDMTEHSTSKKREASLQLNVLQSQTTVHSALHTVWTEKEKAGLINVIF